MSPRRHGTAPGAAAPTPSHDAEPAAAGCGCGTRATGPGHHALAVEPEIKNRSLRRLRRIEGQVRGLQRMVSEERYCADVLTQVASVHEALRAVARELMRNHLEHCAADAIRSDPARASAMYDEILDLMHKYAR